MHHQIQFKIYCILEVLFNMFHTICINSEIMNLNKTLYIHQISQNCTNVVFIDMKVTWSHDRIWAGGVFENWNWSRPTKCAVRLIDDFILDLHWCSDPCREREAMSNHIASGITIQHISCCFHVPGMTTMMTHDFFPARPFPAATQTCPNEQESEAMSGIPTPLNHGGLFHQQQMSGPSTQSES